MDKNDSGKIIRGTFEIIGERLDFNCTTQNASFDEVLIAITKLRDECQRQIDSRQKCPYFKVSENASVQAEREQIAVG